MARKSNIKKKALSALSKMPKKMKEREEARQRSIVEGKKRYQAEKKRQKEEEYSTLFPHYRPYYSL